MYRGWFYMNSDRVKECLHSHCKMHLGEDEIRNASCRERAYSRGLTGRNHSLGGEGFVITCYPERIWPFSFSAVISLLSDKGAKGESESRRKWSQQRKMLEQVGIWKYVVGDAGSFRMKPATLKTQLMRSDRYKDSRIWCCRRNRVFP